MEKPASKLSLPVPYSVLFVLRRCFLLYFSASTPSSFSKLSLLFVVWLFGCLVVWLFGCLVVWLFGCLVVCLFACLFVCLFVRSFGRSVGLSVCCGCCGCCCCCCCSTSTQNFTNMFPNVHCFFWSPCLFGSLFQRSPPPPDPNCCVSSIWCNNWRRCHLRIICMTLKQQKPRGC